MHSSIAIASVAACLFSVTFAPAQNAQTPSAADVERAEKLFADRDYTGAVEAYTAITKADPANGRAWHHLGYSLHMLGKLDEALVAHQKTAECPGEFKIAGWYNVACVHALRGRADEAFRALDEAVKAGFRSPGQLDGDDDLKSLRSDPRYAALVQRVKDAAKGAEGKRKKVAIIVHEGVELLDFAGPAEVFSDANRDGDRAFTVFTVAPKGEPIDSQQGVRIMPAYSFENCPKPDVLVIPGGATQVLTRDKATMDWIAKTLPQTEVTLTVCTGAFTLADQGLLDGLEATTHHSAIAGLRKASDKIKVRDNARLCDNGRIVTTAGISAGIDGALHVVSRLCGEESARQAARTMEYDWKPAAVAAGN